MSARWFYHAPLSKILFYATAVTSLVHIRSGSKALLTSGQIWKIITQQIPFSSTSEMIFGLSYLYELRKFERMMGTSKFSVFLLFISSFSTTLVASLSAMFDIGIASGPYPVIYAYLVLHHAFIPVVKPRVMRILGVNLSDKFFVYLMALPLLCSHGIGSTLPAACGLFSGCLYSSNIASIQSWKLPKPLDKLLQTLSPYIAGSPPPVVPPQRRAPDRAQRPQPPPAAPQNAGGAGGSGDPNMDAFMRQSMVLHSLLFAFKVTLHITLHADPILSQTPAAPLPPPSEEDIINLMVLPTQILSIL